MATSPLQFAKDFGKLKSDLASQPAADLKLLLLLEFWLVLEQHRDNKTYRSYFDEYIPLLLHLISEENLHDLTLPELQGVLNTLQSVNDVMSPDDRAQAQDKIRLTTICLAKMLFYVGCVEEGVKLCAKLAGEANAIPNEYSDLDNLSELNALRVACDRFKDKRPSLYNILKDILDAWESERETLSHERANCLFVEKADHGRPTSVIPAEGSRSEPLWFRHNAERSRRAIRGRLHILQGRVELFGKSATTDEITFANQIVKPDDRFIGVAYDSLEAVRQIFKAEGFKDKAGAFYHAHFSIRAGGAPRRDSTHTFTGDSIGLAVGLVTYTQLLKPEIMRQERFIASDVAFTGGVSPDGAFIPVNKETLSVKVERAFFSPIKYLVLPEGNLAAAKEHLEKLRQQYPRRHLHLVPAERLTEVIENHNVIRAEKVCMGEFVVRKVYRYSRMTKVQVPLLAALLYLMICLLYPKAWIGFDWNPNYVALTKSGFEVLNADALSLWTEEYDCDSITLESKWEIGDLDGDGKNEVVFVPAASKTLRCESNAKLFVYDCDGNLLFQRYCAKDDEYPGTQPPCGVKPVGIEKVGDRRIIITGATRSYPARLYLMFWNPEGDMLGWYINAGYSGAFGSNFLRYSDSQFVFLGYNNRMKCACLYVLEPYSSYGVSPPYTDPGYDLDNVKRGNQIYYVLFPRSDLNRAVFADYNTPGGLFLESDGRFRADVFERDARSAALSYYLDSSFRVVNVSYDDLFRPCRDSLVAEGKLSAIDWSTYCNKLRDSVTYWRDSGWVTEGQLRASEQAAK